MTARLLNRRPGRSLAAAWTWNGVVVAAAVLLTCLVPPVIYALLVLSRFGFLAISGYVPYEELRQAAASLDPAALLAAPVWSMNMTSGLLLSNMYELTVGQLLATLAMGAVIGLNLVAYAAPRDVCGVGGGSGAAAAAGSGLLASVGAASTGIMGCCGSGVAGGVLALAGLGAGSAAALADWSMPVQLLLIAVLALNWLRLRRRRSG